MELKGKVAIVTGAASGIGAATARLLAAKGCRVAVNYRSNAAGAGGMVAACKAAGCDAIAVRGDVSRDDDCRAIARAALMTWGRIDALVNNAATTRFVPQADLDALAPEDFAHVFGVNVCGPFLMTRAVVPSMRVAGGGAVVMVSSISGLTGTGSSIAYAASKGALNTMTLSLARTLGPEIRVNAVCPGTVYTPWGARELGPEYPERSKAQAEETVTLKRAAMPEEIASAVVWFIEAGDTCTGATLLVDGGQFLGPATTHVR